MTWGQILTPWRPLPGVLTRWLSFMKHNFINKLVNSVRFEKLLLENFLIKIHSRYYTLIHSALRFPYIGFKLSFPWIVSLLFSLVSSDQFSPRLISLCKWWIIENYCRAKSKVPIPRSLEVAFKSKKKTGRFNSGLRA